jgi:hypothetical protein
MYIISITISIALIIITITIITTTIIIIVTITSIIITINIIITPVCSYPGEDVGAVTLGEVSNDNRAVIYDIQ